MIKTRKTGTSGLWRSLRRALAIRFDKSPIDTFDTLAEFARTRSAYVAQTALYGYLKTRMGTQYPKIFEDDRFTPSINLSKSRVFAACLADLTIFATALVARDSDMSSDENTAFARACFGEALSRTASESTLQVDLGEVTAQFAERCSAINWGSAAIGETAFTQSPGALIASAPIADELKQYDTEIVTNSIRFRWKDVRDQLRKRLDAETLRTERRAPAQGPSS